MQRGSLFGACADQDAIGVESGGSTIQGNFVLVILWLTTRSGSFNLIHGYLVYLDIVYGLDDFLPPRPPFFGCLLSIISKSTAHDNLDIGCQLSHIEGRANGTSELFRASDYQHSPVSIVKSITPRAPKQAPTKSLFEPGLLRQDVRDASGQDHLAGSNSPTLIIVYSEPLSKRLYRSDFSTASSSFGVLAVELVNLTADRDTEFERDLT